MGFGSATTQQTRVESTSIRNDGGQCSQPGGEVRHPGGRVGLAGSQGGGCPPLPGEDGEWRCAAREQGSDRKDPGQRVRIQCPTGEGGDRAEQQHAGGRRHPPRQLLLHLEGARGDPVRAAAVLSEVQWKERDFHGWSVPEEECTSAGNAQKVRESLFIYFRCRLGSEHRLTGGRKSGGVDGQSMLACYFCLQQQQPWRPALCSAVPRHQNPTWRHRHCFPPRHPPDQRWRAKSPKESESLDTDFSLSSDGSLGPASRRRKSLQNVLDLSCRPSSALHYQQQH